MTAMASLREQNIPLLELTQQTYRILARFHPIQYLGILKRQKEDSLARLTRETAWRQSGERGTIDGSVETHAHLPRSFGNRRLDSRRRKE